MRALFFSLWASLTAHAIPPDPILPILENHCTDCHDAETKKGDISFDFLSTNKTAPHDVLLWGKVREQIRAGTMPPKKKQPLTPDQSNALLQWMAEAEKSVASQPTAPPTQSRTRRLNREEYSNALRDLLGITKRPGDIFPQDGAGGEGFNNSPDTLSLSTLLVEKHLEAASTALEEAFQIPVNREQWLPTEIHNEEAHCQKILTTFLPKAYRRPCTPEDTEPLLAIYKATHKTTGKFEPSLKAALRAALCSPKFLFISENTPKGPKEVYPLNSWDLASKLSILIWSSIPDAELHSLAQGNQLQENVALAAQVSRMLANPKAVAFSKSFGGQWLLFPEVLIIGGPDKRRYPSWNTALAQHLYDEALTLTDHIFRQKASLLDFLDCNYSFVNEPLAKIYAIPGVAGAELRKVIWPDAKRGGISTTGAILATTAYPRRTSPVLRGKWVLEQLLGTPPPPPPPNVGDLPRDDQDLAGMTLRQKLEAHRSRSACSGCHTRLDPPGFALENYDSLGQWRDTENNKPIDATGELPGGRKFTGSAEFRKLLIQEKSLFVRNFCRRLLGYALERSLEATDHPTLLHLEQALVKSDYRLEPLLVALVQTPLFRERRSSGL
jgi:hypothetical protein